MGIKTLRAYLTEFIGTFFLVFTIGMAVKGGPGYTVTPLAAIGIGAILMVMVYMGGHVSGAHYNPAVSTAVFVRGKLDSKDYVAYVVVQIAAAIVAAWLVYVVLGKTFAPAPREGINSVRIFIVEFLYTFALALVVLNAATAPKTAGNSFYGLAIGFTVGAGAIAVGGISGGAFNPAVTIGPMLIDRMLGDGSLKQLWVYVLAQILAGIVAAIVFRIQNLAGEPTAS